VLSAYLAAVQKVNVLEMGPAKQFRYAIFISKPLGKLTLRFRDECDLAEPEEVRGVLDAVVAFMLVFDGFVGCTKSPTGCRRCDERCGPGCTSILKFSD
jgi:hypothetical protein